MRGNTSFARVIKGRKVKLSLWAVVVVLVISATPALGDDSKSDVKVPTISSDQWIVALGSALMTDYNSRGITQSAHKPAANAYIEPRYNLSPDVQLYAGIFGSSIDYPNRAAAQIAFYGGIRPTFGKLSFDLGGWYIYYPGGTTFDGLSGSGSCTNSNAAHCNTIKGDLDFWEIYAKPTYAFNDSFTVGGTLYYSPSVLNSGAPGTYASLTTKVGLPSSIFPDAIGASVSTELGHYWLGTTDAFYGVPTFPLGVKLTDFTTWNVGITFTYKSFSLDLRYYDTNLSKINCNVLTVDQTATFGGASAITPINTTGLVSNWCSAAFIAKLLFDTTLAPVFRPR
jgi:uncharacterized protein (TIGR02001 family)